MLIIISIFTPIKVLTKYCLGLPIIGNIYIFISILIKSIVIGSESYEKPKLNEYKKKYSNTPSIVKSENIEKKYILNLIDELKNKPNKTQKDKDNLSLLVIKLQQIINKK